MIRHIFTDEEEKFIRDHYLKMSSNDMGLHCKCHGVVVSRFLKKNGLIVPKEVSQGFRTAKLIGHTNFTASDDAYIREHYLTRSFAQIGRDIGRNNSVIRRRVYTLGLVIPDEIMQQRVLESRIKPSNEPHNKGKKQSDYMTSESIDRTKATRFQKGQVSHNAYDRDGIITIRKDHPERGSKQAYKYIRISLGKWKSHHQYLWENAHGPIPKGHCLWFKDGDTMNCTLDNLELITRKENYIRNAGHNRLNDTFIASCLSWRNKEGAAEMLKHPELIELKRNQMKLKKAIKEYGKK